MRQAYFLLLILSLSSCRKEHIDSIDVISNLSISNKEGLVADGQTLVNITAEIDKRSDLSKRNIVFKTSAGTFTGNNDTVITIKADFLQQKLIGKATLKMPMIPGKIIISAEPEVKVSYGDFNLKDSIEVAPSLPSSIKLEPSSVSVKTGYQSEVQITGTLKNNANKNVSLGTKVKFEDFDENGLSIHGSYRAAQDASDQNSKVSTFYSPGYLPIGTKCSIKCSVLDNSGAVVASDVIYLTVIE